MGFPTLDIIPHPRGYGNSNIAVSGVYRTPDDKVLPIGGNTGTGDSRYDRFGRGGRLISRRVVERTATFMFYLGNRFYGTITAYVPGGGGSRISVFERARGTLVTSAQT